MTGIVDLFDDRHKGSCVGQRTELRMRFLCLLFVIPDPQIDESPFVLDCLQRLSRMKSGQLAHLLAYQAVHINEFGFTTRPNCINDKLEAPHLQKNTPEMPPGVFQARRSILKAEKSYLVCASSGKSSLIMKHFEEGKWETQMKTKFLILILLLGAMVSAATAAEPAAQSNSTSSSSDLINLLFVFMLSTFIGLGVITRVSRLLHTPLMSLTNAISAIAVVGSLVIAGADHPRNITILGAIALFASMTNIVSGFLITDRMLKMFKKPGGEKK